MMNSKRILAMVLALLMVFSMLPMSAGAEEVPAFSITSATGKAGEEVTVAVTIENNPGVMMYNYGIQYDTTRLERVEMTKGGMDNVGIWTIQDKVLWENNDFTNSYYNGDTVVVKFKIKEDAPAGDAEISISDFMALDYEGKLVEYTLKAGKITVEEKLETLIPFTKANHTDSGAAIHDKYTGVVGLKVEGIKMADWTEWQQGFNYQNQSITIFVDAASKDDAATLSLILAEGQTGSGSIIETPATVQLTDGAGSFTASYMTIGTGGLAPKLHIPITFKLACAEHSFADATCNAPKTCTVCGMTEGEADSSAHQWNNATCTTAKTCSVCGATDGEADPDAHNYVDGVCEHCGEAEAAATYEVKIYGYPNDVYYVVTGKDENGSDILGDKLARTENEDGSITLTVPADVTRIAIYEEPYIYGFGVSPENNEVTIDYVEISIKTPDGGACTTADMTVTDSEGYNQPPFDYESDGMWSISAVIGREYTFTVTAPGYKTAVVKKTFDASEHNYQSFDITLEAEAQEPEEPEGYAIPITGGHLKNYIANIYVSGAEVVGTPTYALGYMHLSETITVQVSAATKDNTATIAYDVVNSEGLTGSVEAFTVALNNGVGSAEKTFTLADGKQITLTINFEIAPCTEHSWNDATCTTAKTCSVCGATEGSALGHNYVDGVCSNCGEEESFPITFTVDGTEMKPVSAGEVTCPWNDTAKKLVLTVPYGSESVTIESNSYMDIYGDKNDKEDTWISNDTGYAATVNIADGYVYFCILMDEETFHLYIEVEAPESNSITKIEISHPSIRKDETTGALSMTMVTGASEQINVKTVLENAELEATQVVAWSSSDPEVASVESGKVTAWKAGSTVITAKAVDASGVSAAAEGEEVLAQFTLTVTDPTTGYTVKMGEDVQVVGNETVTIPVTIGHTGDVTTFNAFDLTFEYDPAVLELTSNEIAGVTITVKDGKIQAARYGDDLNVNTEALTLTFRAITTGETSVKVTAAKVDISDSAQIQDAPDASIMDNITLVNVTGYTVDLPDGFTGDNVAEPNKEYTFSEPDDNYDYDITVTVDGKKVEFTDNEDGTYTIPAESVTGEIVVSADSTPKSFKVTLGTDMTGDPTATYLTNYTATLNRKDGYSYEVTVMIGGKDYHGYTKSGDTWTIPGTDITGEIAFNVTKTQNSTGEGGESGGTDHTITSEGTGAGAAEGNATTAANGSDYTLTLIREKGYIYTVTAKTADGADVEVIANEDGTYTIKAVASNLVITIEKTLDLEGKVQVHEYVNLDGKTMFLVLVNGECDDSKHYVYNDKAMYYSFVYEAYAYLTVETGSFTAEDAAKLVAIADGAKMTINKSYDVNRTNLVDINDAQLVYDIYNGKYDEVADLGMAKFLYADNNNSKNVTVEDAVALVDEILKTK